jgi:uncharacterized membrane protein YeaQ/YmgE (transglycosylase-associated protein family)
MRANLALVQIRAFNFALRASRPVFAIVPESKVPTVAELIVWIVVGLLGGSLAGLLVRRERKGFGMARNLGLGLIGALVGGLLFRLFGLFPGLEKVAISLRDVVAAVVGSLLVLAALWLWRRWKGSSQVGGC